MGGQVQKIDFERQQNESRSEQLRRDFFELFTFGISVSTIATLTAIIAVPMLYNYMQHVQSSLQNEVEFCKHRTDGLWDEFSRFEAVKGVSSRIKRGGGYAEGGAAGGGGGGGGGSCCSCGIGAAGPPGPPGKDGDDGKDGAPGNPESAGADAAAADHRHHHHQHQHQWRNFHTRATVSCGVVGKECCKDARTCPNTDTHTLDVDRAIFGVPSGPIECKDAVRRGFVSEEQIRGFCTQYVPSGNSLTVSSTSAIASILAFVVSMIMCL
ncbi:unnamed protein product [Caenorhabditis bovis]|uniref:Nematode cuticle collagen N-terminal domain-containing protein n=1 Tax=Caenorhabditis bovis TaxID=2654633 RepID=A0A8S1FEG0_9PELO|nr:unnamed protein product [Caenorhabditis bovis]